MIVVDVVVATAVVTAMRQLANTLRKTSDAETQPWFKPECSVLFLRQGCWYFSREISISGVGAGIG